MRVRHLSIANYRGLKSFELTPGPRTVFIGPKNAGKSTVLEAMDLLLHPGLGRPRPAPTELDYYQRRTKPGFEIRAVLTDLTEEFSASARKHLEGWNETTGCLVPQTDGPGVKAG